MVIGKFKLIAFGLVAFTISLSAIASVYRQSESFYKGKTIRIIVGFTPGGFYDRWARLSYAAAITAGRCLPPPRNTSRSRKILREGYARALKESELIAETKKARMDMEAVSGEELQTLTTRLMTQPAAVIQRVKKVLEN